MANTSAASCTYHLPNIIIIIKVFLKHKILSLETKRIHTHTHTHIHTHTGTHTHKHSDYTKQQTPGRLGMDEDAWNRKHGRSTILGKEMFLD